MIGERRMGTLRELALELGSCESEEDLLATAAACLSRNRHDLPLTLVRLLDAGARPALATGMDAERPLAIAGIGGDGSPWPIELLLAGAASVTVDLRGHEHVPSGAWADAPHHALAVALADAADTAPAGVLIAGLNPYRPADDSYRGFVELVAGQLSSSLARVRSREAERGARTRWPTSTGAKMQFFSRPTT